MVIRIKNLWVDTSKMGMEFIDNNIWVRRQSLLKSNYSMSRKIWNKKVFGFLCSLILGQNHKFLLSLALKNFLTHQQHGHATRRQDLPRKRWHDVMEKVGRPCHPGRHQEDCPGSPLHHPRGYRAAQLSLYETGSDIFYFWNIKRKYHNRCKYSLSIPAREGGRGRSISLCSQIISWG